MTNDDERRRTDRRPPHTHHVNNFHNPLLPLHPCAPHRMGRTLCPLPAAKWTGSFLLFGTTVHTHIVRRPFSLPLIIPCCSAHALFSSCCPNIRTPPGLWHGIWPSLCQRLFYRPKTLTSPTSPPPQPATTISLTPHQLDGMQDTLATATRVEDSLCHRIKQWGTHPHLHPSTLPSCLDTPISLPI